MFQCIALVNPWSEVVFKQETLYILGSYDLLSADILQTLDAILNF